MFVRRCFLSFRKLSFAGQVRLQNDFVAWWSGSQGAGYSLSTADRRNGSPLDPFSPCFYFLSFPTAGLQIYPVIYDLLELSKPEYYAEYVTGNLPCAERPSPIVTPPSDRKQRSNLERAM
jgi:hypothetical protein